MHLFVLLFVLTLLALANANANAILAATTTCTTLSTSCETACGPGYKPCGTTDCYNPNLHETCCTGNITCPSGTFCNTEGGGCSVPPATSLSLGLPPVYPSPFPPGTNCNATAAISASGYTFSGTSSEPTSITSLTNGTLTITSASVPANLTLPTTSMATATASNGTIISVSIVSGISAGAPTSNLTYASTSPPTTRTSTVAGPASTGGVESVDVRMGEVQTMIVIVVAGIVFLL